jgi:hypothetical protein
VDPVPGPLLLRKKSGSAGNRTRTSGSVARNFTVYYDKKYNYISKKYLLLSFRIEVIFLCSESTELNKSFVYAPKNVLCNLNDFKSNLKRKPFLLIFQ